MGLIFKPLFMNFISTLLRCVLCSAFFCVMSISSAQQPRLSYTPVLSGLNFPVDAVNDGLTNRMFIVQQDGVIRLYKPPTPGFTTFINISSRVTFSDERGLLSMAFHPDYDGVTNRFFFVYYTITSGSITRIKLARYETQLGNPDLGDPLSGVELISIDKPSGFTNHNGGKLNFGADGMLYFGTGDGGSSNDPFNGAQNGLSYLGKMLRIDVNVLVPPYYAIPPDNPYTLANDPLDAVLDEVWALGLRNPFRWSFDPLTNAMWIADVGQGQQEEVNIRMPSPTTGGVNYGWRCYEGNLQPPPGISACSPLPANYVAPAFVYGHNMATGGFSITGGPVYRGTVWPLLYGYYVFADYVSNNVWVMDQLGAATQQQFDLADVAGFGVDINGEIYAVVRAETPNAGSLMSINAATALPLSLINFTGRRVAGFNELKWTTVSEQNMDRFIIEYSNDGIHFSSVGEILATNSVTGSNYSFQHAGTGSTTAYYRLQIKNQDATSRYSTVILIGGQDNNGIKVYPTVVTNNRLEINSPVPVDMIKLSDANGRLLQTISQNGRQGYFNMQIPALSKGVYFITIFSGTQTKTEKVILQ